MRYIFSLLFGLAPFFPAYSQDSVVCIPTEAARFYLEAEEERWILREKDSLSTLKIFTQGEEILVRDQKIVTYQNDSATHETRFVTLLEDSTLKDERITKLERNIATRKFLEILTVIGIIIISVL